MAKWKRDFICGVTLLLCSVGGFIYSGSFYQDFIKYGLAQPGNYLRLWLALLAILSVILIVRSLVAKDGKILEACFDKLSLFSLIWLAVYVFLLPLIGFLIATPIFLFVLFLLFYRKASAEAGSPQHAKKQVLFMLALSVAVTLIAYSIFTGVLDARLPQFSLF